MDKRPIGIFDSGLGGLTVFKAVKKMLPKEHLIYFGDTAHLPYGSKSAGTVSQFSLEIAQFLLKKKIKILVVACNTASSLAVETLKKHIKIPIINVLEPGAGQAVCATKSGRIAVIGTESTINSGAYTAAIKRLNKSVKVLSKSCPLFVPLVEEGWWDCPITVETAKIYLKEIKAKRPDTIILGCTHYPVISSVIRKIMGKDINIVNSAQATAAAVADLIGRKNIASSARAGKMQFYSSDSPERFKKLARRILGFSPNKVILQKFS